MKTAKYDAFATCAEGLIRNLKKRGMDGYYCPDSASCVKEVLSLMPEGCTVSWGGSMSLEESGMMNALRRGGYRLIDRTAAVTPEEKRKIYGETVMSDYFFCSSNAVTLEGELVNIDGIGNRIACLAHGPEHVILIVGRNKIVEDMYMGMSRARNIAAPANAKRLGRQTLCGLTGRCGDCLSPGCMCSHTVITRHSSTPGRIKVFLVNEDLGY